MVALVQTVAYLGLEARGVEVQCQVAPGLPAFHVVGLPDKAVAESRERVRAAIASMGLSLPPKRITINLSPADLPKEGSHYDLPIALALLGAMGIADAETLASYVVVGELSLDGRLAETPGVLLAALHASGQGLGLICPALQGSEAAWAGDVEVLAPKDLLSLLNHFKGQAILTPPETGDAPEPDYGPDLKDVKGQETAKRALEVAAAGGHNLLMNGPPGSGKSLLASCLPGILPPLSPSEALEVSMVASVAGTLEGGQMSRERPFRAPHHSASMAALVGGGLKVKPGEVSLAHLGVLFLDELPEFQRSVLDSLRQPLESGAVSVARANAHVTFPARVQMIAAMNPCPCVAFMQFGFGLPLYTEIKRKVDRPAEILENPQTIGEHIKRERQIRGLRQIDVAEALNLNPHTVTNWERRGAIRYPSYYPVLIEWLGYDPFPKPASPGEHLLHSRLRMGLTSREMAERWGIDQGTLLRLEKDQG